MKIKNIPGYENWLDENYPNETHAEATRRLIYFCESKIK